MGGYSAIRLVRHDAPVVQPEAAGNPPAKEQPKSDGLSQFFGKVLDQLSLSAWLPAAMLVGCGALIVQLRAQGDFNIGGALIALTAKPLGIIVVLLFAMILATMMSQAFSYTAIRWLEGYWRGPLVVLGVYRLLVRRKARTAERLDEMSLTPFAGHVGCVSRRHGETACVVSRTRWG